MNWFLVYKTELIDGRCKFGGYIDGVRAKSLAIAELIAHRRNPLEGSDRLLVVEADEAKAKPAREHRDIEMAQWRELMKPNAKK